MLVRRVIAPPHFAQKQMPFSSVGPLETPRTPCLVLVDLARRRFSQRRFDLRSPAGSITFLAMDREAGRVG
ncbi:hypothetical protein BSZ14_13465 [Sphingomonas sp. Sph1(2015)]|nr:hypothetical protein BSZ14_13465 [Sphingomonas sp. Sph1(2015)]